MPRISHRFAGPIAMATTATTLFTVSSNEKGVIQHIHIQNPTAAARTITISIGADAAGTRIFDAYTIGPATVFDHFCKYVLEETEVMQAFADTTDPIITIDGDRAVLG